MKDLKILPLVISLAFVMGCASDFVSTDSGSSSATDDSADRSWHEMIDRVNQQAALDVANAAAQQQINDAMAAAQQTMNNATNGQPLHDP